MQQKQMGKNVSSSKKKAPFRPLAAFAGITGIMMFGVVAGFGILAYELGKQQGKADLNAKADAVYAQVGSPFGEGTVSTPTEIKSLSGTVTKKTAGYIIVETRKITPHFAESTDTARYKIRITSDTKFEKVVAMTEDEIKTATDDLQKQIDEQNKQNEGADGVSPTLFNPVGLDTTAALSDTTKRVDGSLDDVAVGSSVSVSVQENIMTSSRLTAVTVVANTVSGS